MSGIEKIVMGDREILCVDYSNLKADQLIALGSEALEIILKDNSPTYILNAFNEINFATATVIRNFEKINRQAKHLIKKQAMLGLNPMKRVILKGFNLILKRDFQAFELREEALTIY
jgi:hypothetical protein